MTVPTQWHAVYGEVGALRGDSPGPGGYNPRCGGKGRTFHFSVSNAWFGWGVLCACGRCKLNQLRCSAVPPTISPKNRDKMKHSLVVPRGDRGQRS